MNRDEAIQATKNGAVAGCISGALTLAIFWIAIFTNASGAIGLWNDPSVAFDIVLIFACAYGIYIKSRFAAVLLFVYFIFAKIVIGIETGKVSGIGTAVVFLYFYGKAIQGAFVFHKIEKSENPGYKATPKWIYYTGVTALIIGAALMVVGLMTVTGVLPSTEVQIGTEISQSDRDLLISNDIIAKGDHIEYFYSTGLISILEGGSILTEDRVILYLPEDNKKIEVYEVSVNDISSIELVERGNAMNNSLYKINSRKPDAWLQIELSAENKGDVKFIEALRAKVTRINP
ncbi:MAG TPA: hypothetical protein DCS42_14115 [Nitrospiraceae bacterium]|nr:MAG: hypothetical protein A2X57_11965 [Nitrospirae bacterium GWD2_57_8]HAS55164.1 hypothetical protein [Nitrospiraceae bacterium]